MSIGRLHDYENVYVIGAGGADVSLSRLLMERNLIIVLRRMDMNKIDKLIIQKHDIEQGGGQDKINKQLEKEKMFLRERIDYLFDGGSFV